MRTAGQADLRVGRQRLGQSPGHASSGGYRQDRHGPCSLQGAGPAITDLLGGRLDFMITTIPSVFGFIDSGKVKPLAVTTKERTKRLPNVPTIAESGWADYDASAWYGFAAEGHSSGDRCFARRPSKSSTARRSCRAWESRAPSRSATRRRNSPPS